MVVAGGAVVVVAAVVVVVVDGGHVWPNSESTADGTTALPAAPGEQPTPDEPDATTFHEPPVFWANP